MKKIPVHLITGFLGAGKTTFLNHLIRSRQPERQMIIENEVGKTNIDSKLVVGADLNVVELTAGCLCCSLNDDLYRVLEEVSYRRDDFDRLLIETTGVADPESLALPFLASPAVERVFELRNTICLVDAENIEHWLAETEESRRQVAFADVILLNKKDRVSEEDLERLSQLLSLINPYANVYTGTEGQFPVDEILGIQQLDAHGAVEKTDDIAPAHKHQVHGISTFTLTFDRAFNLNELGNELVRLLNINRHQIYRIKGLINADNYPVQVVLQSVRNTFRLSDGLPWPVDAPKESKIVFIGKEIKKEAVEKIFRRYLIK
ncbi:MAG: GTP-binding protein [Bacteroidota bacterium]